MKKFSMIIALLLVSLLVVGCAGKPSPGADISIDDLYEDIKELIIEDLKGFGYTDEDFAAEELPGYSIIDLKGDEAEWVLPDLNKDDVEEGFVIKASMMLNSDQIIIIKAVSGKAESIKAVLEAELASQLELWEDYLPDQAEKVRNAKISVQGDFIIYITYLDAEGIEAIFNN